MAVNKRAILLFVGVIVLLVIFVSVLFLQQNQIPVPTTQSKNKSALQNASQSKATTPVPTFAPLPHTPKQTAEQFYKYYFSSPINPLANGGYKTNPYLSQNFKDMLGIGYNNGNSSVFCSQNKKANITVSQEVDVYYDNQYLKQETISDVLSGKELYRVVLQQVDGKWLIYDVTCV